MFGKISKSNGRDSVEDLISTEKILTVLFLFANVLMYRYTSTYMHSAHRRELVKLLTRIQDPALMDAVLDDLLTPAEFDEIVIRWQIVKQLAQGIPQRKIASTLGVSVTKITRGSRELRNTKGGFWKVLSVQK